MNANQTISPPIQAREIVRLSATVIWASIDFLSVTLPFFWVRRTSTWPVLATLWWWAQISCSTSEILVSAESPRPSQMPISAGNLALHPPGFFAV